MQLQIVEIESASLYIIYIVLKTASVHEGVPELALEWQRAL